LGASKAEMISKRSPIDTLRDEMISEPRPLVASISEIVSPPQAPDRFRARSDLVARATLDRIL